MSRKNIKNTIEKEPMDRKIHNKDRNNYTYGFKS